MKKKRRLEEVLDVPVEGSELTDLCEACLPVIDNRDFYPPRPEHRGLLRDAYAQYNLYEERVGAFEGSLQQLLQSLEPSLLGEQSSEERISEAERGCELAGALGLKLCEYRFKILLEYARARRILADPVMEPPPMGIGDLHKRLQAIVEQTRLERKRWFNAKAYARLHEEIMALRQQYAQWGCKEWIESCDTLAFILQKRLESKACEVFVYSLQKRLGVKKWW